MMMTQEQIRGLDQLRQRLSQLSTSIRGLKVDLEHIEPLPTWSSLQSSAQILSYNLQQLMDAFHGHRQFLREAHAYPLTNFPGNTQSHLLEQLLRKKPEPQVEDWIEEFSKAQSHNSAPNAGGLQQNEWTELWNWAGPTSNGIVRPMLDPDGPDEGSFGDDFTVAEREAGVEKVVTGLKRNLNGNGEEEDEDADGDQDNIDGGKGGDRQVEGVGLSSNSATEETGPGVHVEGPAMPLENVLRFITTGDAFAHVQGTQHRQ